jgi:hypothetical protein
MNESASVATHEHTHTHTHTHVFMKTIRHQIITNEAERVWQLQKVQKLRNKASKLLAKLHV